MDAAQHVPPEAVEQQQEPVDFTATGIRHMRSRAELARTDLDLDDSHPELQLLQDRANAGTCVTTYHVGAYGHTAYLLDGPGERVGDLPYFYPQANLRSVSSGLRAYADSGRFDEFLGVMPAELTSFSPVVSMTRETTMVESPRQTETPYTPRTRTWIGRILGKPPTAPTPSVPEFIEKTTEKFSPIPHPLGGTAVRYCYALPDHRTLLINPHPREGGPPIDSVGNGRQITLANTPLKGNLEFSVSTVLPEDMAKELWKRSHEIPALNRLIGSLIAPLCVGADMSSCYHNDRFMQMRGVYASLPSNFGMRILRGDPTADRTTGYISEMDSVRVGSDTVEL